MLLQGSILFLFRGEVASARRKVPAAVQEFDYVKGEEFCLRKRRKVPAAGEGFDDAKGERCLRQERGFADAKGERWLRQERGFDDAKGEKCLRQSKSLTTSKGKSFACAKDQELLAQDEEQYVY